MRFPTLLGDVVPDVVCTRVQFPFKSWAAANRFEYSESAAEFLTHCGSAAEAHFAREFTRGETFTHIDGAIATAGGYMLQLQWQCGRYYVDALVTRASVGLVIEIDGMGFHHRSQEQVAADYLRERRVVLKSGAPLIRFTAREVFHDSKECWRQVEAIFAARQHE